MEGVPAGLWRLLLLNTPEKLALMTEAKSCVGAAGVEVVGGGRMAVGGAGARRGWCLGGQGARHRGHRRGWPCAWRSAAQTAMQWW